MRVTGAFRDTSDCLQIDSVSPTTSEDSPDDVAKSRKARNSCMCPPGKRSPDVVNSHSERCKLTGHTRSL